MQQQSQFSIPDAPLPFGDTLKKAHGILNPMALSVRLPLRPKRVGLSRVAVMQLAGMVGLMLGVSFVANLNLWAWIFGGDGTADWSLFYYALFVLGLGIWQRKQRLGEEKQGTEPHRMYPGDGWFYGFVPLPRKLIDAGLDPALAFIAGVFLYYEFDVDLLGLWLMASGIALCVMELLHQAQEREMIRTKKDLRKEADAFAVYLRSQPKDGAANMAGGVAPVTIPTGIGDDEAMRAQIEKNRLENSWSGENDNAV